jgi:2-polyprenyl-6-methoxyphenol hydroxylase-like FAD-dependent oxidoreductase
VKWDSILSTRKLVHVAFWRSVALVLEVPSNSCGLTGLKFSTNLSKVTYQFETTIHSLRQTQDKVTVDLENRIDKTITTEGLDLVVGADGLRSHTRQLVMGSSEELNCFKPVDAFVAYFSIPGEHQDRPYSKLRHFTTRRIIWMRPMGRNLS